jgi:hypothetical protein
MIKQLKTLMAVMAISLNVIPPVVAVDLITNGSFEINGGVGQIGGGISSALGWTSGTPTTSFPPVAFNFIMDGNADSTGFPSIFSPPNVKIWGPANGINNGFTTSPNGGFFLGADGDYGNAPISQVVSGLTPGQQYELSFYWASAQLTDAVGNYFTGWDVTFDGQQYSVGGLSNQIPSQGFGPWAYVSNIFTASSTSATLQFLATGGPSGLPPMSLLDEVKLSPVSVPEPSTMAMGGFATLFIGLMARRKKIRKARLCSAVQAN